MADQTVIRGADSLVGSLKKDNGVCLEQTCVVFFFFGQPSTAAVCWLKSCDRIFVMILRLLFRIMQFITMLEARYLRFQRLVFFMFSLLLTVLVLFTL